MTEATFLSPEIRGILLLQPLFLILLGWLVLRIYRSRLRTANLAQRVALFNELGFAITDKKFIVGFFHPYCNAGGGGERVLWTAIASMQRTDPDIISVVYSGDTDATKEGIIAKVKARFDIELNPRSLHFVFLESRRLVEDSSWPHFTLLGQSVGSMCLAWEAMTKLIPDLYIDSMGYAFTYYVVSFLGNIPIGAYVHYPTISTDMLARVKTRTKWHTNASNISSSAALSKLKLIYYRLFMYYYALSLRNSSFLMVNSSWTKNHIDSILRHSDALLDAVHIFSPLFLPRLFSCLSAKQTKFAQIVYPPCDTRAMSAFAFANRERVILSVAQFRPEKDHMGQLNAFHRFLEAHPEYTRKDEQSVKLVLVGGSRNAGDAQRVEELRKAVKDLNLEPHVEIVINATYPVVLDWLSRASIGLSTMVDEHFGINIVEFMAAGVIPVAHASGGPLQDIIVPFQGERTGFHACTADQYGEAFQTILTLGPEEEQAMRSRARALAIQRFSEEEFEKGWNESHWRGWISGYHP